MKVSSSAARRRHGSLQDPSRRRWGLLAALGLLAPIAIVLGAPAGAAPVEEARLETAGEFAILASSTITNSGVSTIDGDVGLHPGTAVTGFEDCTGPANCVVLTGTQHITDGVAATAKADLQSAYDALVGLEAGCTSIPVELGGGNVLGPGVYCSPTLGLNGALTLDGEGEYVFLTGAGGSALTAETGSQVLLINGADSCQVYWQVASSADIKAGSAFAGHVLAQTSISFGAAATLEGSALAMGGAVTLINNTITSPECAGTGGTDGTGSPDTTAPPATPVGSPARFAG